MQEACAAAANLRNESAPRQAASSTLPRPAPALALSLAHAHASELKRSSLCLEAEPSLKTVQWERASAHAAYARFAPSTRDSPLQQLIRVLSDDLDNTN
mmetsp:Transcript_13434/g.28500  ORF Transcript_13434/g.28500 Transcript_13434/m.28500 type:complete len:99 (-) Transcript_13434:467-763(-)